MKTQIKSRYVVTPLLFTLTAASFLFPGKETTGSPLDELPKNIRRLTHFGERAAWSPDGKSIAFVHKTLGDAFEIDLDTEQIRCLTCDFSHGGFFRVQYLKSGDYILIGPAEVSDPEKARWSESEMWILKENLSPPPIRLNQRLNEGVAVSREALQIAWAISSNQYPAELEEGVTQLWTADVEFFKGGARLIRRQMVHQDRWPQCWLEPQDFRRKDREVVFSCYQPEKNSEVMGVDVQTGEVTNYSKSPEIYDEPEGIFPGGGYTLVECDRQNDLGDGYIDIWKLKLDGTGRDYTRLTYFSDYPGYKASNPVVSPDGKKMAFQIARSKDAPGVGYGILIFRF